MTANDLYRSGCDRWPSIELSEATFAEMLAAHDHDDLSVIQGDEVFLAFACATGDSAAIKVLELEYMPTAVAAVKRMRGSQAAAEDIAQTIRAHILVAEEGRVPRIAGYAGRGNLRSWLKAIAVRRYLNELRGKKREVLIGDEKLIDAFGKLEVSPELAHLKDTYREHFRSGFSEALAGLDEKQKNLLRFRFVDGLGVTELAKLNGVHRATLHRWLAEAQEAVASATETILCGRLSINPTELASIRRLIRSQLELSLERLLDVRSGNSD